jgi:hypothetical protein
LWGSKDDGNEERRTAEQVVGKVTQANRMMLEGKDVSDVWRELQVAEQTPYVGITKQHNVIRRNSSQ